MKGQYKCGVSENMQLKNNCKENCIRQCNCLKIECVWGQIQDETCNTTHFKKCQQWQCGRKGSLDYKGFVITQQYVKEPYEIEDLSFRKPSLCFCKIVDDDVCICMLC